MRPQAPGESLYDWADDVIRSSEGVDATKLASVAALSHHVGVLVGLGMTAGELEEFLLRLHRGIRAGVDSALASIAFGGDPAMAPPERGQA
jgi:hypothetical protein